MKKKIHTKKQEFVSEYDALVNAFSKVNLKEAVAPTIRGKIVEDEDTYNKVQQLLDCPDMEHAHQFLLDVDFEDIDDETKQRIDDLYQLAISQGYLDAQTPSNDESATDDQVDDFEGEDVGAQEEISDASGGFEEDNPNPEDAAVKNPIGMNAPMLNSSAFTLFYSAMKNGEIKTGECYSNANTLENAKLDAIQKLQKLGFTAVDIIAAEETDVNAKGCDSCQPEEFGAPLNDGPAPETTAPEAATSSVEEEPTDDFSDDEEFDAEDDSEEDDEDEAVGEAEEEKADNKKDDEESEEDSDEEESEDEESADDEKELSRAEKLDLFKRYLEEFKALLQKMKAETYADMALADRAKFYDEMSKIWDGKPDPSQFMTDDNVKQIEHMKVKKQK